MQNHDVEPVLLILGHVHLNSITAKLEVHSCVLDIADAVQRKARVSFAKQHRLDLNAGVLRFRRARREVYFADVIDQAAHGKHIQGTERSFLQQDEAGCSATKTGCRSFRDVLGQHPAGHRGFRGWRRLAFQRSSWDLRS